MLLQEFRRRAEHRHVAFPDRGVEIQGDVPIPDGVVAALQSGESQCLVRDGDAEPLRLLVARSEVADEVADQPLVDFQRLCIVAPSSALSRCR
jgi:hypothetical protein